MVFALLSIITMGIGSFLKIKLYVIMGFASLIVSVGTIIYKVMIEMEKTSQMILIGSLVLLSGIVMVFGAVYYKTHQEVVLPFIERCRKRFGEWE